MVSARLAHQRPRLRAPRRRRNSPADPEPNLLITIDERLRNIAEADVLRLLARAGIKKAELTESPAWGVVGVHVKEADPRQCVRALHPVFMENPFGFRHTHRWIPVEAWSRADEQELRRFGRLVGKHIGSDDSWGIRLERHSATVGRDAVLGPVAEGISNQHVALDAPNKTVLIEVVGEKAGLSVLESGDQLSVDRSIRDEFVEFRLVERGHSPIVAW